MVPDQEPPDFKSLTWPLTEGPCKIFGGRERGFLPGGSLSCFLKEESMFLRCFTEADGSVFAGVHFGFVLFLEIVELKRTGQRPPEPCFFATGTAGVRCLTLHLGLIF